MEMHRDLEADVISWELSKASIDHAKRSGNVIVHFSEEGKPVLIEVLEANKFVGKMAKAMTPKDILNTASARPS